MLVPLLLGLGDFTWAQVVVLAAASIAATGVGATLRANAQSARRQTLTTLYGDALGAVAEYLEGPYRILRKDGGAPTRSTITSKLSDVKTSIDHHQALLRLHADPVVADAFDHYVSVAKTEAGVQMHDAWEAPPVKRDSEVNLGTALPRPASEEALNITVEMMQSHLRRRWYNADTRQRYDSAARAVHTAAEARRLDQADKERLKVRQKDGAPVAERHEADPSARFRRVVYFVRRLRRRTS